MKKLYEDYIFLVRTVLEGGRADDFSGDFEKLLELAREHNMTNILWYFIFNEDCTNHILQKNQKNSFIST